MPRTKSKYEDLFNRVYLAYSGKIYNFVMRITSGNSYLAEEITQQCFVRLWINIDNVRSEAALLSYMFSTARNLFLHYCEREFVQRLYLSYLKCKTECDANETEVCTDDFLLRSVISSAIEKLPPRRREVFRRGKIDGLSMKEIADIMGISENTVERHMTLAMKQMRQLLDKYSYCNCILIFIVFVTQYGYMI